MTALRPRTCAGIALAAACVAATVALATPATPPAAQAAPGPGASGLKPAPELVERGRYLVTVGGCGDCHTPMKMGANGPEPDMERMLSGHPANLQLPPPPAPQGPWIVAGSATNTAWAGPWGISYTANLTPHATGLGDWTLQNFRDALRTGKHMGRGRPILPPMPIPAYRNFTDADIEAIYGYLRTLPPIDNQVPDPVPPPAPQG